MQGSQRKRVLENLYGKLTSQEAETFPLNSPTEVEPTARRLIFLEMLLSYMSLRGTKQTS